MKFKKGDRVKVYGGIEPVLQEPYQPETWYWCNGHSAKVLASTDYYGTVRVRFDGRCQSLRNCAVKGVESLVHAKQIRKIKKKAK